MLPIGYEKKSFLRFDVDIDTIKLKKEFNTIPNKEWATSYWGNIHCSIGMLLLRGGDLGTSEDFFSDKVYDTPLLESMPYIKKLISTEGPFGDVCYAFIFKTEANGVTLRHRDIMPEWKDLYRVHVPIYTNPNAYLISNEYSQHYTTGYAWTFDNQADHGVVNGNEERVHLIFDVKYTEKMKLLIDSSDFFKGEIIEKNNKAITNKTKEKLSYLGDTTIKRAIITLRSRGIQDQDIAKFFNTKKIPSKFYPVKEWDSGMIQKLVPN